MQDGAIFRTQTVMRDGPQTKQWSIQELHQQMPDLDRSLVIYGVTSLVALGQVREVNLNGSDHVLYQLDLTTPTTSDGKT